MSNVNDNNISARNLGHTDRTTTAGRQFNDYGAAHTDAGQDNVPGAGFSESAMDHNSGSGAGGAFDVGSGADPTVYGTGVQSCGNRTGTGTGFTSGTGTGAGTGFTSGTRTGNHQYDTTAPDNHGMATGKPSIVDKIVGGAEKLAGSATRNPNLKERGQERKQGGFSNTAGQTDSTNY